MGKMVKSFLIVFLLFTMMLSGSAYGFLHKSIAKYQGEKLVPGINLEIEILRDEWGIPHIYANSLEDLFFAQGYVHAQDRLFQIDLSRRAVQGRLAEIFGKDAVEADKFFLTIGFYRAAEKSLEVISEDTKRYLSKYAEGINAFIETNREKLPLEFSLLNYEPEPWVITDSLAIGKYMSWVLGGNMQQELIMLAAMQSLPRDKWEELIPSYPEDDLTIVQNEWQNAGLTFEKALTLLQLNNFTERATVGVPGIGIGSNNWVVSGKMTKSGKPILANDMHLEIKAPSIWYQNHLIVKEKMNVTGVMFPGVPGVIVGHNEKIAWGVTNLGPDVQDLYIEKRNKNNPHQYLYQDKWENAQVFQYEIPVRNGENVHYTVDVTRHGPIISDLFPLAKETPISLQWTNNLPTTEIEAVIRMNLANNWQEFEDALNYFLVPAQNFVYADIFGNIAYKGNGLIPIRAKGKGLFPVPGWTGEYDWVGYIPYNELPKVINPKEGLIVTANNKVIDDSYPYYLTDEWAPPYRATTIYNSLAGKKDLTLKDVISIQTKFFNLQAARIKEVIIESIKEENLTAKEKESFTILKSWLNNPVDEKWQIGPTIYQMLYNKIIKNTFQDEMEKELYNQFLAHGSLVNILDKMLLTDSLWFDDIKTKEVEGKKEIIFRSYQEVIKELESKLGDNIKKWEWGEIHTITFDHPLGVKKGLDLIFNKGPFPMNGSGVTPGAANYSFNNPFFVTSAGPWRYGVDMSDLNHGLDILFGGSSGHPFSQHYADQIPLWLSGEYKTMSFAKQEIEKNKKSTLFILKPAK